MIEQKNEAANIFLPSSIKPRRRSFHQVLFTQSIITLLIVLFGTIFLFSYFYTLIEQQQTRSNMYVEVDAFSNNIQEARETFQAYFETPVEARKYEFYNQEILQLNQIESNLNHLKIAYSVSPNRYYIYQGLKNGFDTITELMPELEDERETNFNAFALKYYRIDTIFQYMLDYASNRYLSALVIDNSKIVASTEGQITKLRSLTIIFSLIIIFLYLIVTYFIARKMTKPIDAMVKSAHHIANGKLDDEDLIIEGPEELVYLEKTINYMKKRLRERMTLIEENTNLEKEIHQSQVEKMRMEHEIETARFNSLQSQINPHFFFNTLNIMSRMAMFEQAEKTMQLIDNMAGFFRYTFQQVETVSIKDEITFVKNYLKIQRIRFEDRINYTIDVDENLQDELIPPLIIQPFVENAMKHGLEPKEDGGTLTIQIYQKGNMGCIKIEDDGVGINMKCLHKKHKDGRYHIGITNVTQRLSHFFEGKSHVIIRPKQVGTGTTVIITFPRKGQTECIHY